MKFLKTETFGLRLEVFIAVMLGITAVMTAWAAWQASLYGGNQASNYAQGTAEIADANSLYSEADQMLVQDMDIWNRITDLRIELEYAVQNGNDEDIERYQWKLDQIMADNVTEEFATAIDWADSQTDYASPFYMEGYVESYYADAAATYDEGYGKLDEGDRNNHLGDMLGLVTVIYSVALFLLGIANSFKNNATKSVVVLSSVVALIIGLMIEVGIPIIFPTA